MLSRCSHEFCWRFVVVVVLLVVMVVRMTFSRKFFDRVLLSQKTYKLLQGYCSPRETGSQG